MTSWWDGNAESNNICGVGSSIGNIDAILRYGKETQGFGIVPNVFHVLKASIFS